MSKLWGGRFEKKEIDPKVMKFTSSLSVDKVLAKYDCAASKVHAAMLEKCGYITKKEKDDIVKALDEFLAEAEKGALEGAAGHEDIHSAVQAYVEEKAPEAAKKMHTGRSRNEQVVNDVRLYCRESIDTVQGHIRNLQKELVKLAEENIDAIMPGYTHLKGAQPILLSHLLLAYCEMLERDLSRFEDAQKRLSVSVMGSGALAGSSLDLDRKYVAEESGFDAISKNSIDAVSDRDFIAELVFALSMTAVHLSRVSEDMILYGTEEFGFLEIGEDYCTGSSLMPQKKNPDVLELVRGRSSQVIGDLGSLLVLLKGLPHSYNRDLQEDKRYLFDSVELVSAELDILAGVFKSVKVNRQRLLEQLENEFIYSTDIAEYLVRKGVPFRDSHAIVGGIVKLCSEKKINISDLSISELKAFSEKLEEDVYGYLNPENSVKIKRTEGSTNPDLVKKEIEAWKRRLAIK